MYRVAHEGLGAGVPWFVVDPVARTIALEPVAGMPDGQVQQIVATGDGFAVSHFGDGMAVLQISSGAVQHAVSVPFGSRSYVAIAPNGDGSLTAAYDRDGSMFVAPIPAAFDALGDAQEVAKRSEVGGCSATHGGGGGLLAPLAALAAIARRRRIA